MSSPLKPHRQRRGERLFPRDSPPENKIDGAVALIMALGRHMSFEKPLDLDAWLANPFGLVLDVPSTPAVAHHRCGPLDIEQHASSNFKCLLVGDDLTHRKHALTAGIDPKQTFRLGAIV